MKSLNQFETAYGIRLNKTLRLQLLSIMVCLELVIAFSYLGFLSIPPISVTTLHILVIVAAMYFGPWDAVAVAVVFAGTSIWKASVTSIEIGDVAFSPFLSGQPVASLLMAVGARLAFALFAGFAFRLYFSKERKHPYLGSAVIAIVSTLIHSLLVYACMLAFFNAADVETSKSFGETLILNNLLLFVITVLVVLLCRRMMFLPGVKRFFEKISMAEGSVRRDKRSAVTLLFVLLILCLVFISMHFISRLNGFIRIFGQGLSSDYISWTNALLLQFIVAFAAVFGALSLIVRWIQDYYAAQTMEANIRAMENAEIANKSKTKFLFNMSHDIRTPMNAILGYTDIALRHPDEPEKVEDCLVKIRSSGDHLLNLINDILEMSRIEAGKVELAENPMDIRDTVEDVKRMSQVLAMSRDITFTAESVEIKTPFVLSDELHINEVLINLVSNAVKYNRPNGSVELRAEQLGDAENGIARFRFTVTDTGIGMSEEFRQHLFEDFSRENTATVSGIQGTGLGLSIVKRIVDLAGGTIGVQSRQGEGSTFTVELPLRVMDETAERAYKAAREKYGMTDPGTDFSGRKVLLVEDNEMNREIAAEILEEAGLTVDTAEDGADAVQTVTEKGPDYFDFILMDIQMPVMDGYEATKAIRERFPSAKLPIIALSANAFAEDKAASLAAGMNDHVAKPIDVKELMSVLTKFL